ncbi:hypothetical protein BW730_03370 [Tessaracoccus aquimaris]|uniref:HTH cro/C1-type domain-containing protein n=1 Tax=Tessaracoccus aquimaris TaxID=1332264 RepID=A0A1Q2CKS9_9ACTN|nr:helix-turn-helix transcriptional regulator [Tessaracoccus aquimaris]AQP46709.1 hypothetical protein BW730_03370 [Tessaracoccus aquimaris]
MTAPQSPLRTPGPTEDPGPLWRELVGDVLRESRLAGEQRLVDVARRAGVSAQYLSEVERGLKDPSSELLGAVAGALDLTVLDVASRVLARQASTLTAASAARAPRGAFCLAA